jgi:PAS domain S-box-containing protein
MERLIREILTKDLNTRITIFQTIFDAISDYIFIMKADEEVETFKYLFANKHALDNLQLDESIYGKSMEEVLPAERVKFLKQKYQEAIITKKTIIFEERYFTKKGAVIGEMALNPIFIEDGKSVLVFAIVRDVTERKNREQALLEMQKETQRNEQKLSSLIKNNTEAVYEFDTKGHFRSVNEALEKILGYSSEELIGKAFVPLLIPEEVEKTLTHFQKAVEGTPQEYELTLYNQLYEKVNVNIKNIPIIVDGKVDGVYGIAKNITEKKKIEQEKSELRQQLEMVWNNTSDAIFLLGADAPIVKVNPSFTKILSFTEEELKGRAKLPFLPPHEGHNQMMEIRKKMRRGEKIENLEV